MRRETGVDYVAVVVVCHRGWPEYVDDNTQKRCPTASHANQVCLCVSESELICMQFIGANFMQIPGKHSMLGAGWVFKLGAFCDESTQRAHTAHRPSKCFCYSLTVCVTDAASVSLCCWRMKSCTILSGWAFGSTGLDYWLGWSYFVGGAAFWG